MGDGDAIGRPGLELGVAEVDRMGRHGVGCGEAGLHQAGERAVVAAPPHDGDLGFVLRDMQKDPRSRPLGLPRTSLQKFI